MDADYVIRILSPLDEDRILAFNRLIFRQEPQFTTEYWRWRHEQNPSGESIAFLAESGNDIVGYLEYLPVRATCFSKDVIAGIGVESSIGVEFRGRGLRANLRARVEEEARRRGWAFFLNFPNKMAFKGALKYSAMRFICPMGLWVKPLYLNRCGSRRSDIFGPALLGVLYRGYNGFVRLGFSKARIRAAESYDVQEQGDIDEGFDEFWKRLSRDVPIATVRDAKFFRWRHYDNPVFNYTVVTAKRHGSIVAVAVLRVVESQGRKIGQLLQLCTLPRHSHALIAILEYIGEISAKQGVAFLMTRVQEHLGMTRIIAGMGFVRIPFRRSPMVAMPLASDIPNSFFDRCHWLVTMGDIAVT